MCVCVRFRLVLKEVEEALPHPLSGMLVGLHRGMIDSAVHQSQSSCADPFHYDIIKTNRHLDCSPAPIVSPAPYSNG